MLRGTRWSALLALAVAASAGAQSYPVKNITLVIPYPPGGGTDLFGRMLASDMAKQLGQQIIVDNRSGAAGNIGAEYVTKAAPDGYTLLYTASQMAVSKALGAKLRYDPQRDLRPISMTISIPLVLVVHPSLPVKNVKELIALARARPGEITYSSPGTGNGQHLATALFASMAKIKLVHVPYKGNAPSVIALLSGETQLTHSSVPAMLPHVRAGKLRALGVAGAQRVPSLPEFPTVAEAGLPGFDASGWAGMLAPANTPQDIVQRLNKAIVDTLAQKQTIERMLADGALPAPTTPQEFAAYLKSELKKWGEVVKVANIDAK